MSGGSPGGRIRLGVVSDVHWDASGRLEASWHNPFDVAGVPGRVDRALAVFADAEVDAVVALGDLTHDGDEESTRQVVDRLSAARGPVVAVAGNHDCLQRDDQLERCCGAGVGFLGGSGVDVGGLRVSGVAIESDDGAFRSTPDPALEHADVLLSHFPVLSRADRITGRGLAYSGDLVDQAQLAERAGHRDRPLVVLSGHLHVRESHAEGPVLQLAAGALVEAPFEVAIVEVAAGPSGARVRRRVVGLGPSAGERDPVFAPVQESWTYDGRWRRP